ncbi:MAG: methyltransferase domain-containing protein [Ignavibacteria bacterium]|nr:methyltransferase domain-containing protein [Ignavibacteria bacterium]
MKSSDIYLWQHSLKGESERLQMMSDLLDPNCKFHLERIGIKSGWRCLEIGAGNGSLSKWMSQKVAPNGHVVATDIRTDLMSDLKSTNLEVRQFDVVKDEPPDTPFDLVVIRALLHHLPQRREVVSKMIRWLKPGGWLFIEEPDFYPTWTAEPRSQKDFWSDFISWAATNGIDYYVGRKVAPWLQEEGMKNINAEGHAIYYNGGSEFARWWISSIAEVADSLQSQGGVSKDLLDEFFTLYNNPDYWTATIAFTATIAQRAE